MTKEEMITCKYCGPNFIPSLTATVNDECHDCMMANAYLRIFRTKNKFSGWYRELE